MNIKVLVSQIVVAIVAIFAIFGKSISPATQTAIATAIMATIAVLASAYGLYHHWRAAQAATVPSPASKVSA